LIIYTEELQGICVISYKILIIFIITMIKPLLIWKLPHFLLRLKLQKVFVKLWLSFNIFENLDYILKGLTLVYRSIRRGYTHYIIGQLKEIAKIFFKMDLKMTVAKKEIQFDTVFINFK